MAVLFRVLYHTRVTKMCLHSGSEIIKRPLSKAGIARTAEKRAVTTYYCRSTTIFMYLTKTMLRKSTVDFVELMRDMGRDVNVFVGLAEAHQAILFDIS